jgi:UDP-glucuronate 4-epimerase
MKILVTGAAGFIGSALAQRLVGAGHQVTAIDNFSDYYDVNLKKLRVKSLLEPVGLQVTNLDISTPNEVAILIASIKPDVVINLAAQAGVRLGLSETYKYVESNLIGFSNVLIATIENKVPFFYMHPHRVFMVIKLRFLIKSLKQIYIQIVFMVPLSWLMNS